jgi:mannosyl-oligosaccharide alpha-1,2-mannosidase
MPGNLILGARYLNNKGYEQFAKELMDSCYKTWANSPTGIAPERWGWIDDSPIGNLSSKLYSVAQIRDFERIGFIPTDNRYLLRPGTIHASFTIDLLEIYSQYFLFIMQKPLKVYSIFID